jgi:parvulin-like peptidyl-prolyl isomerase
MIIGKRITVSAVALLAAIALVLFLRNADDDRVLARIDGDPLTKAEYRYCLNATLFDIAPSMSEGRLADRLREDVGGISAEESLKAAVIDNAKQLRVIEGKYAELGLDFDARSADAFEESVREAYEYYGGEESLRKMLKDESLDYGIFERQQRAAVMADAIEYELFQREGAPYAVTDGEKRAAYEANYARVKHLSLALLDESGQPLPGEAREEKRSLAESLLTRIREGEDFETLLAEFGGDAASEGYLFTRGETDPIFEEAAFALAPGELSALTESRYGFHIIKRYPLEYEEAYRSLEEDVNTAARHTKMQALMREWTDKAAVEIFYERIERDKSLAPAATLTRMLRDISKQRN